MDKVKVLIEISGGVLQAVHSNVDLEYVLVDYDDLSNSFERNLKEDINILVQDSIEENLYNVYKDFKEDNSNDATEVAVRERLKEINF